MRKPLSLAAALLIGWAGGASTQSTEPFAVYAARNGISHPERYQVAAGDYFLPLVTAVDQTSRTITLGGYYPSTGTVVFRWDDYREWIAVNGGYTPAHLGRRFDASLPVRFVVVSWTGENGDERSSTLYAWLDRPNPSAAAPRRVRVSPGVELVVSDLVAQIVTNDPVGLMRTLSVGGRPVLDVLGDALPDVFDFVYLAPLVPIDTLPTSSYVARSNDTAGIGLDRFADPRHPKVRGLVVLSSARSYSLGWSHLCREMLRAWANYAVSTDMTGLWGFSTAYGKLGGMNGETLSEAAGGRYVAEYFVPGHNTGVPYSPLELYLMGLAPPTEVQPLRVFEGARIVDETPQTITFTAASSHVVTIQDVIAARGKRVPAWPDAPRTFRALAVVVTDTEMDGPTLTHLERALAAFSLDRSLVYRYDFGELNFSATTRGRATIRLDGLRELFAGGR